MYDLERNGALRTSLEFLLYRRADFDNDQVLRVFESIPQPESKVETEGRPAGNQHVFIRLKAGHR